MDTIFLRADLLDLITLPTSGKLQETTVLSHLHRLLQDLWSKAYKNVDLKPLAVDAPAGASRAALPLWFTLKDWLAAPDWAASESRLPLSSACRKAYWTRFLVVLYNLQRLDLIRDAVRSGDEGVDLSVAIEFRYFAILLWLQTVRLAPAAAWPRPAEMAVGRRPRSVSDGALEAPWSSPPHVGWESRSTRHSALSPRQSNSRETSMSFRLKAFVAGSGSPDEVSAVSEAFFKALPGLLCIIGFHMQPDLIVESASGLKDLFLSAHHLKYLALVLQLRAIRPGGEEEEFVYDPPAPSKILEKHIFTELQNSKLLVELPSSTPLISIGYLVDWLQNQSRVEISSVDALSSFAFAFGNPVPGANRSPARPKSECRSPRSYTRTPTAGETEDVVGKQRFRTPDRAVLIGKRKEIIHVPIHALDQPTDLLIIDCTDCSIIATAKFMNVKIGSCRNVRVIIPCAMGSVIIHFGKNVAVHCACTGILVSNSYDTRLYVLSSTPPVIVGDTRDLHLGPYNILYEKQEEMLADTGIQFNAQSLRLWSTPIICPLSYTGRTNTPRDEALRKESGRGSVDDTFMFTESGMMPSLMKPLDLEILMIPASQTPPLPPKNLVLPETHAQAVATLTLRRQAALAGYLERVAKCRTPDEKRVFIQKTENRFCEWLQTHRKVNELLSKSEEVSRKMAVV